MMLKVTEVASYLRVTRQMVYQVIREGGIKPVRVGKALRISRETLRDFIAGGAAGKGAEKVAAK